jgi:hypothetical protein
MSGGLGFVLATCGGGGNDAAALLVMILALAAWGVGAGAVVCAGTESGERKFLLIVLIVAAIVAPLVFVPESGLLGDQVSGVRCLIALLIPAAIGFWWAARSGSASPGRALVVAMVGAVLLPGGLFVIFVASLGIGTGCLE